MSVDEAFNGGESRNMVMATMMTGTYKFAVISKIQYGWTRMTVPM
jgi:hypothetical protein